MDKREQVDLIKDASKLLDSLRVCADGLPHMQNQNGLPVTMNKQQIINCCRVLRIGMAELEKL